MKIQMSSLYGTIVTYPLWVRPIVWYYRQRRWKAINDREIAEHRLTILRKKYGRYKAYWE